MNKRIEKIVKNYEAGKITVRRDQLRKAVEEGAFDYMIYRGYDEVYNVEPVKMEATVENIPDYWFRGANIYVSGIKDNVLKISMSYGYSYKYLFSSLEEKKEEVKEVVTTEEVNAVEGVKVVFNEEKNGIEITFASKDLATEEIRTELKKVGFRYFFKLGKWIAKQNAETIATVNKLFNSNKEVEEIDVTEEVKEMMSNFDKEELKAFEAKRAEEEREYQEYLKEQEEARKEAEERQKQIKADKEYINNNVEVVDLEEENQYFVKNAQFANCNKNNTLEQYQEEVEKGDYYNDTLKVTREIHFKDLKSYNLYINMLLHDFDFIDGTGGSYTDDLRINSMTDYYNMTSEEQKSVEWLLQGIAVYVNDELMFVVDAQGYSYARYVGLIGTMTTIEKEIEYNQVVDAEEVEELKKEAEEITSVFNKVVEKNSLDDWYNTRRKFVKELKDNILLSFDKPIVQQIKDEKIKNYMYRVLNENDSIIDQFIDNKFAVGEKLTIVKDSAIGGASISHIIFNNYEEIEEYNKKAIKMTLSIKNKKGLYNTTIGKDKVLIYKGWFDIPTSVLYEDTSKDFMTGSMTKYGSYDTKALDAIVSYLSGKNILPTINTYKPVF